VQRILKRLAWFLLVTAAATWLVTGANHGWTKTSVPVKTLDPVTGLEGITYVPKFLPGVDFLGVAFASAALLASASLCFRHSKPNQTKIP